MEVSHRIVRFVTRSNWVILILGLLLASMISLPLDYTLGILFGGVIVALNFHLLKKTLFRSFQPDVVTMKGRSLMGITLMKYYIRFTVSGGVIYLLITNHIVHPLGLVAGLSVIVASMFIATMLELTRLFFKEAV
ncbi:MAG: ATP synthase subunit I [Desulfobacteraceae bacterium]|nr:MAG: ATP synthase subunit I [Desulfobacteraceae bacterium]